MQSRRMYQHRGQGGICIRHGAKRTRKECSRAKQCKLQKPLCPTTQDPKRPIHGLQNNSRTSTECNAARRRDLKNRENHESQLMCIQICICKRRSIPCVVAPAQDPDLLQAINDTKHILLAWSSSHNGIAGKSRQQKRDLLG